MGDSCATIDIYNLQPSTRKKLFLDYFDFNNIQKVTLEAGYQNGKFDLIYKGRILSCRAIKEHTDVIMRIEAQSGLFVLDSYISSLSTGGKLVSDITNDVLSSTSGLEGADVEPITVTIPRPVALVGNEMAVLQTYTKGNAIVDNEKVIVLSDNKTIDGEIRVIDDSTGLLGVPEREQVTLTVKCIFEPRIKVGQGLEIKSKVAPEFDGQYKVWGVSHSGKMGLAASGECTTTIQLFTGLNIFGRFQTDLSAVQQQYPQLDTEGNYNG